MAMGQGSCASEGYGPEHKDARMQQTIGVWHAWLR